MTPAKSSKPKAVKAVAPATPALPIAETTPAEVVLPVVETPAPVAQQPQAPATPPNVPAADDLNQPGFPLHPERVWPD